MGCVAVTDGTILIVRVGALVPQFRSREDAMDEQTLRALQTDRLVDITTTGRKTGQPRRIEIGIWPLSGGFAISGRPGRPRGWYANLRANPDFTIHLKQSMQADLPARAIPVTSEAERRTLITEIARRSTRQIDVDAWVAGSPLVRVEFRDE